VGRFCRCLEQAGKTRLIEAALLHWRAASMNVVSLNKEGVDAGASDNEGDALPAESAFVASPTTSKYDLRIWASLMDF
jgi:hypothetical protein